MGNREVHEYDGDAITFGTILCCIASVLALGALVLFGVAVMVFG